MVGCGCRGTPFGSLLLLRFGGLARAVILDKGQKVIDIVRHIINNNDNDNERNRTCSYLESAAGAGGSAATASTSSSPPRLRFERRDFGGMGRSLSSAVDKGEKI